jgi:hypothetical protein
MPASLGHVVFTTAGRIHLVRCEPCMYGYCPEVGEPHGWAGPEDLDYAKANGQDVEAIKAQRCPCNCEWAPAELERPDDLDDLTDTLDEPCTECGERASCGVDFEGRPLFHRQAEDEDD